MFLERPRDYIGAKRDSKTPAEYANPIEAPTRGSDDVADTVVVVVCVTLLFLVLTGIAMGVL